MRYRLRRTAVTLISGVAALAAYAAAGGVFTRALPWWGYAVWAASSALTAMIAGSYVGPGGFNRGCTRCSQVALLAIPVSLYLQAGHHTAGTGLCSVAMLAMGLIQRVNGADECAVPAPRGAGS